MIIASAIIKDRIIYTGKRHHNIIWNNEKGFFNNCEQGFITETGQFVSRKDALKIAEKCNQIIRRSCSGDELYSEDVW